MNGRARRKALVLPLLAAVALGSAGCRSLERFDTSGQAAYCGAMVRAPLFQDALLPDNTPPNLHLHLELDVSSLTTHPGTLTSSDAETGLCSSEGKPLFDGARLRAIDEMFHDSLSDLQFGDGHQHDFFAWVDSTCQGTMLAVISLLTNGDVEVRLLKPAADPPEGASAAERPGFAVFGLKRSETGCNGY